MLSCSSALRVYRHAAQTRASPLRHLSVRTRSRPKNAPPSSRTRAARTARTSSAHKSSMSASQHLPRAISAPSPAAGIVLQRFLTRPRPVPRLVATLLAPCSRTAAPPTYCVSELFGHTSFVLVATSYALDDYLMLRVVATAGCSSMLFFTYFHPHGRVLWLPFRWNALFILINSVYIAKVMMERAEADRLTDSERAFHHDHLSVVDIVDFAKLLKMGRYERFGPGQEVVTQGTPNRYIRLVVEGELDVYHDGRRTYTLQPGNFMCETGLHAGLKITGPVEASATVQSRRHNDDVVTVTWDRTALIRRLEHEQSLARTFRAALNYDIVSKLERQKRSHVQNDVCEERCEEHLLAEERYTAILKHMLESAGDAAPDDFRGSYDFVRRNMSPLAAAVPAGGAGGGDISDHDREEMFQYRTIHGIGDDEHREALKKCGWTPEEFQRGHQGVPQATSSRTRGMQFPGWSKLLD
eukprot:CAMPEP_0194283126 /NCGR_PEP_ID=MMETSP0169-20130528/24706_1 /TAXON_ID=218684 /ORGANISM="Corethron pennatum, Strain L29A3" /LENGTH=468 /DNA_ID=CAMNT_0039028663 /DNA_START=266 /DNA_END=1672 /DNA_ORIENTATION=-